MSSLPPQTRPEPTISSRGWYIIIAVSLLALAFRLVDLAEMPPGLHYDEAFNGLDAFGLLSTPVSRWPLFFTGNFGREPLFIYLLAAMQALLGPSPLTLRLLSALVGWLLTPALIWLGWELAPGFRIHHRLRYGLWSGMAVLTLLWSQVFARYAIRAELFALTEILLWASLWRAWRVNQRRWWVVTGILAGLNFYTYLPSRLLPLVLIPMILLALWRYQSESRTRQQGMGLAVICTLIVAAPLALYFWQNPVSFATRSLQVNILAGEGAGALWQNFVATLRMAFLEGDANPRNNIPGRPVLDWLMAPFFLLGLLISLRYIMRPAALFLLSWLAVMLLPTILSDYAPAYHRAIGAMPAFVLLIALGLEKSVSWGETHLARARRVPQWAGWMLLILSVIWSWRSFSTWSHLPDLFYARDVGFQTLGQLLVEAPSSTATYISPRGHDHPTVRYALLAAETHPPLSGFDGRICVRVPKDQPVNYVFLTMEDPRGPNLISSYFNATTPETIIQDAEGQPWAQRTMGESPPSFPEMQPLARAMADHINFMGYWLSQETLQPGERLYIRLFWQASATPLADYTGFAHLLAVGDEGALVRLTGSDSQPGSGSCATGSWQPGEIVVDEMQLVLPADLSAQETYYLGLGFYTPEDGKRLAIANTDDDEILIGPLSVNPNQ